MNGDRWLLAWGISSIALGGASLIVPLYVVQLGGSGYTLGLMAAVAAFVGVPGALAAGPLADRGSQHRVVAIGAFGTIGLSLLVIPALETVTAIVIVNGIVWLAFAATIPVLTLLVVLDAPEPQWSNRIARLNTYQGVGWALGLLIGAVVSIAGEGWWEAIDVQRALLIGYAFVAAVGLVGGMRWLPQPPTPGRTPDAHRLRRAIGRTPRVNVRGATFPITPARLDIRGLHPRRFIRRFSRQLATYYLALFLSFAGFSAFFAPLPAYLTEAALSDGAIFMVYVVSSVASAVCFGWVGDVSSRRGPFPVNVAGLTVRAISLPLVAGTVALLGVTTLGLIVTGAVFAVIGVTWAIIIVTAGILVTQLSPPTIRGEALGVYSALMALAGGVGSIIGGRLALIGYPVAFLAAGVLILAGAVVVLVVSRGASPETPTPSAQPLS